MDRLPAELWRELAGFLPMQAIVSSAATCPAVARALQGAVARAAVRDVPALGALSRGEWGPLWRAATRCPAGPLPAKAHAQSSFDNETEQVENTLWASNCTKGPRSRCSCTGMVWGMGDPCYWSSGPSATSEAEEWLEYELHVPGVLRALVVTAYQARWQPEGPTYAPRAVSVVVAGRERGPWPFPHSAEPTELALDEPVLASGVVRVRFHGHHQRQTLDTEVHGRDFYTCITQVVLLGAPLSAHVVSGLPGLSGSSGLSGLSDVSAGAIARRACAKCWQAEPRPRFRCSRCRAAFYCCREHQRTDWVGHSEWCRASGGGSGSGGEQAQAGAAARQT